MRIVILLSALLFGCQAATTSDPSVHAAWMSPAPPGAEVVAGYLTIDNPGPTPWTLVGVDSPRFERIEVHTMTMQDGMMRMRPAGELTVPAGGSLALAPGGTHLMMFGPHEAGAASAPATVTLKSAGRTLTLEVELPVGGPAHH